MSTSSFDQHTTITCGRERDGRGIPRGKNASAARIAAPHKQTHLRTRWSRPHARAPSGFLIVVTDSGWNVRLARAEAAASFVTMPAPRSHAKGCDFGSSGFVKTSEWARLPPAHPTNKPVASYLTIPGQMTTLRYWPWQWNRVLSVVKRVHS